MIEELFSIEKLACGDSRIHRLDARVKIAGFFALILGIVAFPYTPAVYSVAIAFFIVFLVLWVFSGLPPRVYARRLVMILPFGIFLIAFQIFFENRFYTEFHPIVTFPFGIHIYAESVQFATILLVKFLVCISFIILLSSTTRVQDLLEGAGRLGLPAEFTLILGMMVRYLFVFGYMYRKVNHALQTRCFDPLNRHLPYRYRLQVLGNAIGTMFIRSYEQGERTYTSMLCRGYGRESHLYITPRPLAMGEAAILAVLVFLAAGVPLAVWFAGIRLI